MAFPATRLRRLRKTGVLRDMVRETELSTSDLVYPMFVQLGTDSRTPIEAMPGIDRLSIAHAVDEAGEAHALGIPAVLLFGLPAEKDEQGSGAWDDEGVVQLATRAIKDAHPDLVVITDLCLCEYTSHGHCGVLTPDGTVDNDTTLELHEHRVDEVRGRELGLTDHVAQDARLAEAPQARRGESHPHQCKERR
jgi:porphobilinogen synthase